MHGPVARPGLSRTEDCEDLDALLEALHQLLGVPLSPHSVWDAPDHPDVFLPRSWLSKAYDRARKRQGEFEHRTVSSWSRRRMLVGTLNRLGADVERVLSGGPEVEVATLYRGLRELDEAWATEGDSFCGCRRTYWQAGIAGRDEDGTPIWEHRCRWCGATRMEVVQQPSNSPV